MRFKKGCLVIMLVMMGLCFIVFMFNLPFSRIGNDGIEIAEDTTVLLGPVRDDGGIDYAAELNRRASEGVTPGNNMVAKLFALTSSNEFGSTPTTVSEFETTFATMLGLEGEVSYRQGLLYSGSHFDPATKENAADDVAAFEKRFAIFEVENGMVKKPWTAEQLPEWAKFLSDNKDSLDAIVQASKCTRYYHPIVDVPNNVPADSMVHALMVHALLPIAQTNRHVANELKVRVMLSIGEGDIISAIEDTKAIRRLANLQCQATSTIEKLVAGSVFGIAIQCEEALLNSEQLTVAQLTDYQQFIAMHSAKLNTAGNIDNAERFMGLDQLQSIQIYGSLASNRFLPVKRGGWDSKAFNLFLKSADLAEAMRVYNGWMDELVEALNYQSPVQVRRALYELEEKMVGAERAVIRPATAWRLLGGAKSRGRVIGEIFTLMLLPATMHVFETEVRVDANNGAIEIAFAVQRYRQVKNTLPESLEHLIPDFMNEEVLDPCSGKPYLFIKTLDGFLVYSVGLDEKDNFGRSRNEVTDQREFDVRVCMGTPPEPEMGSYQLNILKEMEADEKRARE